MVMDIIAKLGFPGVAPVSSLAYVIAQHAGFWKWKQQKSQIPHFSDRQWDRLLTMTKELVDSIRMTWVKRCKSANESKDLPFLCNARETISKPVSDSPISFQSNLNRTVCFASIHCKHNSNRSCINAINTGISAQALMHALFYPCIEMNILSFQAQQQMHWHSRWH